MPLLQHDFRHFLDALDRLNPAQIEDAQTMIRDLRLKTGAISEIEAWTNQEHKCPFCGDERRQKWGRIRTKIQRYRCSDCKKTYSGRTGSALGRIHRPDLFMELLKDMLGTSAPKSVRLLAKQINLNKYTVWRWRMLVFSIIRNSSVAASFSGIIERNQPPQVSLTSPSGLVPTSSSSPRACQTGRGWIIAQGRSSSAQRKAKVIGRRKRRGPAAPGFSQRVPPVSSMPGAWE